MYDKTVRRRRVVLGLLVACSLILLTAYFGEEADWEECGVCDVCAPEPGSAIAAAAAASG